MKVKVACAECGKEFENWPSQRRRFCSKSCSGVARHKAQGHGTPNYLPTKPRRGEEIPCPVCGKLVYRNKTQAAKNKRYCSVACANDGQKKGEAKKCKHCGAEFWSRPSSAGRKYCSKKCEVAADVMRPLDRIHNGRPAKQDKFGYVYLWEPSHPRSTSRGWQPEHRLIAEKKVGRLLESHEHVHHINGVKSDNRPENLQVLLHHEHSRITGREFRQSIRQMRAELAEYRRRFGPLEDWEYEGTA